MATTTLGNKSVGSIVKLKENGVLVDFYVAKHDYENGLNGSGRTLVVRKDCYDTRQWHTSNVNAYATIAGSTAPTKTCLMRTSVVSSALPKSSTPPATATPPLAHWSVLFSCCPSPNLAEAQAMRIRRAPHSPLQALCKLPT